jgi:peptidoglycan hydrolase CwlO-like protein
MRKTAIALLAIFCIFVFSGCTKPKPTKEENITRLKAKMYDVDRKIHKIENTLAGKPAKTKKQKARIAEIKKKLEPTKQDLDALQARVDSLSTVNAGSWESFTTSLDQGINGLNRGIEKMIGTYQETQREETQPQ